MCLFVRLVNETQCSYTEKWCRIYFQKLFTKELLENFTKNYKEMAINTFEVGLKLYFIVTYYNTVYLHLIKKKKLHLAKMLISPFSLLHHSVVYQMDHTMPSNQLC